MIYKLEILMQIFKKKKIHFLHIGKTGGTSVRKLLEGIPNTKYDIVFHNHTFGLSDVPKSDAVIFFLRNPIERFVSGFYSRMRQGKPRYNVPWSVDEEIAFNKFETPNQLAEALSNADLKLQMSALEAISNINHVKTHYSNWLVGKEYLNQRKKSLFFIGDYAQFDVHCKDLFEKITGTPLNSLPPYEHKGDLSSDKRLSSTAIQNLNNWYRNDIDMYLYCKKFAKETN